LKVLVIIPCFNEEKSIHSVVEGIEKYKGKHLKSNLLIDYLVINDCSSDATLSVLQTYQLNHLNLPVNLGIGGCMQAGYRYAFDKGYDVVIQHDGDGQHDAAYFDDVIAPIVKGEADIVIGSRFIQKEGFQSTGIRRIGIRLLSNIIWLCTGQKVCDVTSGYRAINRRCIEQFTKRYAQDYPEPEAIVDAIGEGAVIVEIPVVMEERKEGESSIGTLKSIHYMIKVSLSILLHRIIVTRTRESL